MSYSAEVIADSPEAYYRMDESSGNLADSSGHSRTATMSGGPAYSQTGLIASDPSNTAILSVTAGTGSFALVPAAAWQSFGTGDFAIELWYKTADSGTVVIAASEASYWMGIVSSKLRWNGPGGTLDSTTSIDDNLKHYLAITRRSGTMFVYVDAVQEASGSEGNAIGNSTDGIGLWAFTAGTFASTGTMDEAAIYSAGLTAARVTAHYAAANSSGGQPLLRRFGATPFVGGQGVNPGARPGSGRMWGRTRSGLVVPKRFREAA